MQRVKTSSAVTSKPAYTEPGTPGYFTSGDPVAAVPATVPGAQWFNQVQEELLNAIKAGGLTPDATKDDQLAAAIVQMIAAQAVTVPDATEAVAGIIKRATRDLALGGVDDTTAMSPADVAAAITGVVRGYTRQQYATPVVLTGQSGAVAVDADLHQDLDITATGAITLANPINAVRGKTIFLTLTAATALAITWGSAWHGNADYGLDAAFVAGKHIFLQFRCVDDANWLLMGRSVEA